MKNQTTSNQNRPTCDQNRSNCDQANCKQALVSYGGKEEAAKLYAWLNGNGYRNVGGITPKNYKFPVIVVNESGEYFGTNATCMAAAASCGIHAVSVDEFIARGFDER